MLDGQKDVKECQLKLREKATTDKLLGCKPVLRKSFEFNRVKVSGFKLQSYYFTYLLLEKAQSGWRLGITVSTKIDKRSVARNRMKRVLRECYRALLPKLQGSYDIVIIARKSFYELSQNEIMREISKTFQEKRLLKIGVKP